MLLPPPTRAGHINGTVALRRRGMALWVISRDSSRGDEIRVHAMPLQPLQPLQPRCVIDTAALLFAGDG